MPNTIVERSARRLIAATRAIDHERHPWSDSEDAEVVAPLVVAYAQAAADLYEYLVDVHGGIDGTAEYRDLLHTIEALLPQPLEGLPPCEGPMCAPGSKASRSWATPAFFAEQMTRHALDLPRDDTPPPLPACDFGGDVHLPPLRKVKD